MARRPGLCAKAKVPDKLSPAEILAGTEQWLEMGHAQALAGNALDADDIEMFERERWSHERCRAYILEQARKADAINARNERP